ncbi:MAG TPA: hypothetical protein VFJ85_04125 [Acidimicrobiales bacterium]|nr:hypothetical protein [Acidimicrobiales bacterium]
MADLVFVVLLVALFAATAAFVKLCDRLVGSDLEVVPAGGEGDEPKQAAA